MRTVAKIVLFWSLGALLLAHLAIVVRLALKAKPRRRAMLALMLPPLAPWWAHHHRWRILAYVWLGSLLLYASALITLLHW